MVKNKSVLFLGWIYFFRTYEEIQNKVLSLRKSYRIVVLLFFFF